MVKWVNGWGQVILLNIKWLDWSVSQWVGSDQMTKNLINLDLIKIIQFCLKIYDW